MKKQLLSLIVLVVVLCLTACTANQNQVSKPTSPENLGYSISREKISQTVLEDSEFFNQETFYHPDLYGDFIVVGAYWHDYLGDELYPVAFCRQCQLIQAKLNCLQETFQFLIGNSIRFLRIRMLSSMTCIRCSIQREQCRKGLPKKWSAAIIRHRKNIKQARFRKIDIFMNHSTVD